jgi:pimeloyl-ACP methyl ester carboxylesterase
MSEHLELRIHGPPDQPTLVFLPGLHGDWTLAGAFRSALGDRVRFVEISYPRTLTWSLQDYARAVEAALLAHDVTSGWLFGESFSSQVAWAMAGRAHNLAAGQVKASSEARHFQIEGIILEGGFVRHPAPWGVWAMRGANRLLPLFCLRACLRLFGLYSRIRFRRSRGTLAGINEFVQHRADRLDRAALRHRLRLIAENDLRPIARHMTLPVYSLTGLIDPLVPWPWVSHWLKRHCPGYRGTRVVWSGHHNVCLSAPATSADQILEWIGR